MAKSNSSIAQTTSIINNSSTILNTTLTLSAAALTSIVKDAEALDVVFYHKGADAACQHRPFNVECTRITQSEGSLERLGTVGEYTIFAGNQTWAGKGGLAAVQVGIREIWSMSVGTGRLRVTNISV